MNEKISKERHKIQKSNMILDRGEWVSWDYTHKEAWIQKQQNK